MVVTDEFLVDCNVGLEDHKLRSERTPWVILHFYHRHITINLIQPLLFYVGMPKRTSILEMPHPQTLNPEPENLNPKP